MSDKRRFDRYSVFDYEGDECRAVEVEWPAYLGDLDEANFSEWLELVRKKIIAAAADQRPAQGGNSHE